MLKGVTYQLHTSVIEAQQGCYIADTEDGAIYIGDWRIECDVLFHRHPEEAMDAGWGIEIVEYDVNDRVCWKCEATCSNEIWFAHKLQQI